MHGSTMKFIIRFAKITEFHLGSIYSCGYTGFEDRTLINPYDLNTNVHCTILVNNQLDAQFLSVYIYFYTLYISSSHVLIIRRLNCINTTSGMSLGNKVNPLGFRVTYA